MFNRYLILLFIAGIAGSVKGQDPIFSQFYASPLQLNPAFAGVAYAPFVAVNYRSQFASFGPAYTTYAASYDQYFDAIKSGIGLSLMGDNAGEGIYTKNYVSLHYSYRVDLSREIAAKIGIEAGLIQTRLDWDKLIFYDQLDPETGSVGPNGTTNPTNEKRPASLSNTLFDISSGILVYGAGFHAGLAINHMTSPNEGFINSNPSLIIGLPIRWTLHGGYEYEVEASHGHHLSSFISPNFLFSKQGDFKQVNVGAYAGLDAVILGASFRHTFGNSDAAILLVGFRQEAFKIGYSYDITVSGLSGRTGGSHEFSFTMNLDPDAGKKLDINDCFQMFR